ncbi:hypothetical protein [Novosphingopyxis sp.]|uniref:hypothetical protein n=1 Tax=Novosphingopyxis sp. TaxID=2709690 RepID=UPI003B5B6701
MPCWHSDSIFGDGPRTPLDRERRAVWRARIKLARRPGGLTLGAAAVAGVLLELLGADGRLDPTHETIAKLAHVSVSTVGRALDQLQAFGFLDWARRLVRGPAGARQTSSAFRLKTPDRHSANQVLVNVSKRIRRLRGSVGVRQEQADAEASRDRQLAIIASWARAPS